MSIELVSYPKVARFSTIFCQIQYPDVQLRMSEPNNEFTLNELGCSIEALCRSDLEAGWIEARLRIYAESLKPPLPVMSTDHPDEDYKLTC